MKQAIKRTALSTLTSLFGDDEGFVTLPTLSGPVRGMRFRLNLNQFIEPLYLLGTYERREADLIARICQKNWVAWDCGIYLGYYTALLATRCREVIAFEPDPRNTERTRSNLQRNAVTNVHFVNAAIGAPSQTVELILNSDTNSHIDGVFIGRDREEYSQRQHSGSMQVRSMSLDEALNECLAPDLVKIDIEGAEQIALRHVEKLCTEVRPVIILELHNPECDRAAWEFSQKYNYSLKSLDTGEIFTRGEDVKGTLLCSPR